MWPACAACLLEVAFIVRTPRIKDQTAEIPISFDVPSFYEVIVSPRFISSHPISSHISSHRISSHLIPSHLIP
eukprot:scaffold12598_cov16-Prasinocladus_malaysianus.AAC.1